MMGIPSVPRRGRRAARPRTVVFDVARGRSRRSCATTPRPSWAWAGAAIPEAIRIALQRIAEGRANDVHNGLMIGVHHEHVPHPVLPSQAVDLTKLTCTLAWRLYPVVA